MAEEDRRLTDRDKTFIRNSVTHQILALTKIPDPDDALELAEEIAEILTVQLKDLRKAVKGKRDAEAAAGDPP